MTKSELIALIADMDVSEDSEVFIRCRLGIETFVLPISGALIDTSMFFHTESVHLYSEKEVKPLKNKRG